MNGKADGEIFLIAMVLSIFCWIVLLTDFLSEFSILLVLGWNAGLVIVGIVEHLYDRGIIKHVT